ncbi:MAG: hypothetical protein HYS08_03940 [Chlamydiae bacterium]|nr:hypothetical protein [Chlamydiota bacterium]MBI3266810.1 hypothetical protein [Chlamydiota bacterium]
MKDTSLELSRKFREMLMQKTSEERLLMGGSMFGMSKQCVTSSILRKNLKISFSDLKKEIFLRFYGREFDSYTIGKITRHLAEYGSGHKSGF